jgi:hypothetical protein
MISSATFSNQPEATPHFREHLFRPIPVGARFRETLHGFVQIFGINKTIRLNLPNQKIFAENINQFWHASASSESSRASELPITTLIQQQMIEGTIKIPVISEVDLMCVKSKWPCNARQLNHRRFKVEYVLKDRVGLHEVERRRTQRGQALRRLRYDRQESVIA